MDSSATITGRSQAPRHSNTGRVISLLVTTSYPSSTNVSASSGGALTLICPSTGSIQSSTRIQGGDLQSSSSSQGQVGVSSLSIFPRRTTVECSSSPSLAIAYGSSTAPKRVNQTDDSYGMLFTIRRTAAASPILHWKCRLPEPNMSAGLLVSPVSPRHVVGGGTTGTLYVWDMLQGGNLVRTIPSAHYRAITRMIWSTADTGVTTSPWNALLCTGGADGMVHVFSHLDLVEQHPSSSQSSSTVHPIRTWSKHHLAVTALVALNGGRVASAAEDGQIIILELCSGSTIATIQLPDAIQSLCTDAHGGRRLFAGSKKGVIYVVDLDSYSLHCTVQMGATIVHHPKEHSRTTTLLDRVFGSSKDDPPGTGTTESSGEDSFSTYQATLRGHDRAVTSLAVFEDSGEGGGPSTEYVVSGDESGVIRLWDSRRACCIRVIHAWSSPTASSVDAGGAKGTQPLVNMASIRHPVTSISIVRDETNPFEAESVSDVGAMFGNKRRKNGDSFLSLVSPLQKFTSLRSDGVNTSSVPIPFVEPRRTDPTDFWDLSGSRMACERALRARRKKIGITQAQPSVKETAAVDESSVELQQKCDEIQSLQKELDLANEKIARWEVVNNKLMSKLKEAPQC